MRRYEFIACCLAKASVAAAAVVVLFKGNTHQTMLLVHAHPFFFTLFFFSNERCIQPLSLNSSHSIQLFEERKKEKKINLVHSKATLLSTQSPCVIVDINFSTVYTCWLKVIRFLHTVGPTKRQMNLFGFLHCIHIMYFIKYQGIGTCYNWNQHTINRTKCSST